MNASYSAYVPCRNNGDTLRHAVASVFAQDRPPAEVIVIDDGSAEPAQAALAGLPVRIVRHERSLGRGAARARAFAEASEEFVLGCDAGKALAPDFATRALRWMEEDSVAGVFGRLASAPSRTVGDRWRNRHLFRLHERSAAPQHHQLLVTGGAFLRRPVVGAVGGFDPACRHSEDADLGRRLLAAGHDVVADPAMELNSLSSDSARSALGRYWRWHVGLAGGPGFGAYLRLVWYSWRTLAVADLRAGEPAAALVSLVAPHYCALRTWWERRGR